MRLLKIECKKIITHPFLWIVWVTFVLFQLFQIYGYVGNSFMQQNLQNMYTAVLDAGVAPEEAARNAGKEVTAAEKESHEYNEKSEIARQGTYGESEYREAYEDYRHDENSGKEAGNVQLSSEGKYAAVPGRQLQEIAVSGRGDTLH